MPKIKVEVSISTNKELKKVSIWVITDYNPDDLKLLEITDYEGLKMESYCSRCKDNFYGQESILTKREEFSCFTYYLCPDCNSIPTEELKCDCGDLATHDGYSYCEECS